MTYEVQSIIRQCDYVIYLVNDPAMKRWISENSKKSISLDSLYFGFEQRKNAYDASCYEIIRIALQNESTCFVTYGHPLFLSNLAGNVVAKIENELLPISIDILPGISSLDALFCDLRLDPIGGLQAYEATDFINKKYSINANSHLILWQIGVVGIHSIIKNEEALVDNIERKRALSLIQGKLMVLYNVNHPIILYVASMYPSVPHERIDTVLGKINSINIPRLATAYIPPELNVFD